MQKKILITGASGNLGGKVATELLTQDSPLRLTGRNHEKLSSFTLKAEIYCGNLEEEAFLERILEAVDRVFLVLPSLKERSIEDFARLFLRIAEQKGVTHIVNISNCTLERFGKPTTLLELEDHLNQSSAIHIKHLRCANFFENLNWGIQTPYHPDIRLPYISSYEIAHIAARYLRHLNFQGRTVDELMGRADYSMRDFATLLGIEYQQQPATPENSWFFDAFNTDQYRLVERTPENTSRLQDPRFTLEYFLAHHFNQSHINESV